MFAGSIYLLLADDPKIQVKQGLKSSFNCFLCEIYRFLTKSNQKKNPRRARTLLRNLRYILLSI